MAGREYTLGRLHRLKMEQEYKKLKRPVYMSNNSVFDSEKIRKRMEELEGQPRFQPDKDEMRYTATQLFETGIEATVYFVLRNGEMLIYDSTQKKSKP